MNWSLEVALQSDTVSFLSDSSHGGSGFSLTIQCQAVPVYSIPDYEIIKSGSCSITNDSNALLFESSNPYPSNDHCNFKFSCSSDSETVFRVNRFDIEEHTTCEFDSLGNDTYCWKCSLAPLVAEILIESYKRYTLLHWNWAKHIQLWKTNKLWLNKSSK